MNEKALSAADLDELEEMAATVESGKMTSALYGTLLPGVFPALVAMARQAPRHCDHPRSMLRVGPGPEASGRLVIECLGCGGRTAPVLPKDAFENEGRYVFLPQALRWIPVEERLPEGEVLFLWNGHVACGSFDRQAGVWREGGSAHLTKEPANPYGVVTHWMPLPAPPTKPAPLSALSVDMAVGPDLLPEPGPGTGAVKVAWVAPPEPPLAIVGRAEPAPPVPGRVGFCVERIVPADDVEPGRRKGVLAFHVIQLAQEMAVGLAEEWPVARRISARPYRIRISVEPEE